MARGGRRKGSGRKPTGRRRVAMLIRVHPEVRRHLEHSAKRTRRTLSAEAEQHLADALRLAPPADEPTRALGFLINAAVKFARGIEAKDGHEFNWRTSRFDFEALKAAVLEISDWLGPAGTPEESPYPREATPGQAGHTIASVAIGLLQSPNELHALGERRQATRGALFYSF